MLQTNLFPSKLSCWNILTTFNKSSHQRCSIRKGVLRNFTKFTGKQLCQSLFFNKVAGLKNTFFTEHRWTTVSGLTKITEIVKNIN